MARIASFKFAFTAESLISSQPRHAMRFAHLLKLLAVALPAISLPASSNAAEALPGSQTSIPQCEDWLKTADSFLTECRDRQKAAGDTNQFFAYFNPISNSAHFLQGCVIKANGTPNFVGVYFTFVSRAARLISTMPVKDFSFNGDVTVSDSGRPLTLIAVRPFSTEMIKTIWSLAQDSAINCRAPMMGEHSDLTSNQGYYDFSSFATDGTVEEGAFSTTATRKRYIALPNTAQPGEIVYSWFDIILIDAEGSVFVQQTWFDKVCSADTAQNRKNNASLLAQACRQ